MSLPKENKKIIKLTYCLDKQVKRSSSSITKTNYKIIKTEDINYDPSDHGEKTYITYEIINAIYRKLVENNININISNKKLFSLLRRNIIHGKQGPETLYQKHIMEHFINFCRHISYRISSYKSQDREKQRGDYKTTIVKNGKNEKNGKIHNTEHTTNQPINSHETLPKKIHTDSFNYINKTLYKNKYFSVLSFLSLFIDSNGKCFYCEKPFELKLTKRFMTCSLMDCHYHQNDKLDSDSGENSEKENKQNINTSLSYKSRHLRWSLERINNTLGHYQNNCVLACLGCNLKRRTKNHKSFKFTENLNLVKCC